MRSHYKLILISIFIFYIGHGLCNAKYIDEKKALEIVKKFDARIKKNKTQAYKTEQINEFRLSHREKCNQAQNDALFVFNKEKGGFFIINGRESSQNEVLGFSDKGSFDPQNIPPALAWWLQEYARQIEYEEQTNTISSSIYNEAFREPIAPLIKTKWDQDWPYNLYCPAWYDKELGIGGTAPTGCVATAMAQVMNYYKWPSKGNGTHSYNLYKDINEKNCWPSLHFSDTPDESGQYFAKMYMDFSEQAFDWDNMLEEYPYNNEQGLITDNQSNAVAYLMKACGYSVDMIYERYASGGGGNSEIIKAMSDYFQYRGDAMDCDRNTLTLEETEQIVYNELASGHPILWSGHNSQYSGHRFICDGYQDGYFHFNWGWSGSADGWFKLSSLTPRGGNQGDINVYNFMQEFIVGLYPDNESYEPSLEKTGLQQTI